MVLMEKALAMKRRNVDTAVYTDFDATENTWVTNIFDDQVKQTIAKVSGFVDKLSHDFQKYMVNVNAAVLTTLKEPVRPRFGYQIAVSLDRELNKTKRGRLGLENTKLYDMEPFSGTERPVDFGIELYDIESSWK